MVGYTAVARKRNNAKRKRSQREKCLSVSLRVSSIIAAKRSRKAGGRRKFQGMCVSLPSPDSESVIGSNVQLSTIQDISDSCSVPKYDNTVGDATIEIMNRPSKFLSLSLNVIEESLRQQRDRCCSVDDKRLYTYPWGFEVLKSYMSGKDVLDTSGWSCTPRQIAWLASIAADSIARKENDGLSLPSPYFLFLVTSKEKAYQVRSVCKPLRTLGLHTVCIHSDALLEHQIEGLKSCEPEFVVSTPYRLLELFSARAIDLSGIGFMVIDGVDSARKDSFMETVEVLMTLLNSHPYTVAFSNSVYNTWDSDVQDFFTAPVNRISFNNSILTQADHILQTVTVCQTAQEKYLRGLQVLRYGYDFRKIKEQLRVLYIIGENCEFDNLSKIFEANGYSISNVAEDYIVNITDCQNAYIKQRPFVSMIKEKELESTDLHSFEAVILMDFVQSTETYRHILTTMARTVPTGCLLSFITKEQASLADGLITILEECRQRVPESLKLLRTNTL